MTRNQSAIDAQYKKMTETPVAKLILVLAIPTIISMLVTSLYNMADTYFVGTIGTSASGATGVVFGLMAILQAFGFMFGHGAGSNISRKLGAHDVEAARRYASTSFFLSILTGLVIMAIGLLFMDPLMRLLGSTETILPYARTYAFYILIAGPAMTSSCVMNNILRYEGKAFYAMLGLTSGGILNIFGDALLIRYFNMGIRGAGLSTAVSQYISAFILLLPYLRGKTQSHFRIRYMTKDIDEILNIVMTGSPSLARQGLSSIATMVLNASAGVYGDAAIAAMSIVGRVCMFLFCITTGIGQGLQPVSAFNFGAKKYSRVRKGFFVSFLLGTVTMAILATLGFLFAEPIVQIFRNDPDVIRIGSQALRYQCMSLAFVPLAMNANMLFQSIGQSKTALFLACLRSGISFIPTILLLSRIYGLLGVQISQPIADVITGIVTLPFLILFLKELPKDAIAD